MLPSIVQDGVCASIPPLQTAITEEFFSLYVHCMNKGLIAHVSASHLSGHQEMLISCRLPASTMDAVPPAFKIYHHCCIDVT
jgi:hypothetical protein